MSMSNIDDRRRGFSLCRELDIDALVVTGEDPVWNEPNGWPHQMKPVFASDFVAAYACR
jgi:hypothetical protein